MNDLFINIFNLGVTAGWLVLAILICRPLMKKAPKWINCLLWGIVGLRLVFPFSLESIFSLVPSAEPLPQNITMSPAPAINSGVGVLNDAINPIISTSLAPTVGASVNPMQIVIAVASWVWVIGIALMLGYGIVSYISLRIKVRVSVKGEEKVYFCDDVDSPFILGVFRPRIYVPSGMRGEALDHVLSHERAHLRRGDHLWKPIGFTLLALYWFNPLLWAAYALLCRDIEAACDEKVIKSMPNEAKKSYSEALLACSLHRRRIMACPLAFGEVGVKERIKMVLNYKKPAFWIIIVALVATLVLSVCFLTNPRTKVKEMLEPGTEWVCRDDVLVSFYVDDDYSIKGYLSQDAKSYVITIYWRAAGNNAVAEIYKDPLYDIEITDTDLLLSGKFKMRRGDLVLEVDVDNLGLMDGELVFEKTDAEWLLDEYGNPVLSGRVLEWNHEFYVQIGDSGCDVPGVNIELKHARDAGDDIIFQINWINGSDKEQVIGPHFEVFHYEGDELVKLEDKCGWDQNESIVLSGSNSSSGYNITEHYDISTPGKYRFECHGAWVEFEVVRQERDETLLQNEDGTELFAYDPSKKYTVYVWQMAKNSYSFGLLETKARDWLDRELMDLRGVNAEIMRNTLASKNLGADDVNILAWQNPLSSYIGDYANYWTAMDDVTPQQNMYIAMIYDMLFGDSVRSSYPSVYESKFFDVDGDGEDEYNRVCLGLTDGKFEFSYIVSEDGRSASYYDTFYTEPMSLKFFTSDGKVRLRGVDEKGGVHIYAVSLDNGHVKLTEIEEAPSVADTSQNKLDLSKADLSLVDRIVITNGQTGEVEYLSTAYDKNGFNNVMAAIKTVKARNPVSNKGHYGFAYHVELYYDYQTVFTFSLCNEPTDSPRIVCGYYETDNGFNYAARYELTSPSYEKLAEVLGKYFK